MELKQLRGAQMRLERNQDAMQVEMHRMETELTAKLDAILAALGHSPPTDLMEPVALAGAAAHAVRVCGSIPEPAPEPEPEPAPPPKPDGDAGGEEMAVPPREEHGQSVGQDMSVAENSITQPAEGEAVQPQTKTLPVAQEGEPNGGCDAHGADSEQTAPVAKPARRVKLADLSHSRTYATDQPDSGSANGVQNVSSRCDVSQLDQL
jgi:hypothetical protein